MTDVSQERTALGTRAVRASDTERDQVVAQLQRHFAEGRLSLAELEERVGGGYAARTREQLRALTADLPADAGTLTRYDPEARCGPELWLLCLLLWVCPPAGIVYWLLSRRSHREPPATETASSSRARRQVAEAAQGGALPLPGADRHASLVPGSAVAEGAPRLRSADK